MVFTADCKRFVVIRRLQNCDLDFTNNRNQCWQYSRCSLRNYYRPPPPSYPENRQVGTWKLWHNKKLCLPRSKSNFQNSLFSYLTHCFKYCILHFCILHCIFIFCALIHCLKHKLTLKVLWFLQSFLVNYRVSENRFRYC